MNIFAIEDSAGTSIHEDAALSGNFHIVRPWNGTCKGRGREDQPCQQDKGEKKRSDSFHK